MKKIISLLFAFSFPISLFAQTSNGKLEIYHLVDNFYVYKTFNNYKGALIPANALYLVTKSGVVMIDTPWDSTQFQPLLDSIKVRHNKKVVMCIATHWHEDRTGGLEFYRKKGIKTFTTKQTDELGRAENKKRAEFLLSKDSTFNIGGYKFQTFYGGQGHTPDNIIVWFSKAKILYGGCLIKSVEATDLGFLGDANVKEWTATLNKIKKKFGEPNYVIPGHDDWKNKNSIDHTLELVREYLKKNKS
jgi:metallo-beta-lactamase class B